MNKSMKGKRDYSDNESRPSPEWLQKLSMVYSLQPIKSISDSERQHWKGQPT